MKQIKGSKRFTRSNKMTAYANMTGSASVMISAAIEQMI